MFGNQVVLNLRTYKDGMRFYYGKFGLTRW